MGSTKRFFLLVRWVIYYTIYIIYIMYVYLTSSSSLYMHKTVVIEMISPYLNVLERNLPVSSRRLHGSESKKDMKASYLIIKSLGFHSTRKWEIKWDTIEVGGSTAMKKDYRIKTRRL
jgi:hypothetical protein